MTDDHGGMVPRKAAWASLITVAGLVLLFSFKTPGAASVGAANGATGDQAIVDDTGAPSSTGVAPRATARPVPTPGGGSGTGDTAAGSTSDSAGASSTPAPTSTATTARYKDGTYTGASIQTRYGTVEVQVTVSGGEITDVTALSLPDRDNHSARISSKAAPLLHDEVLTAQSADIDLLSGATYTSDGYERSLQAALDQAAA